MKLRWKEQEMIFAGILTAGFIILILLEMYRSNHDDAQVQYYASLFREHNYPFTYWGNVLLPKIAVALVFYLVYISVNLFIIPAIRKITFTDFEKLFSAAIIKVIMIFVITAWLMAISINAITLLARPHLSSYAGSRFLAIFGYNDKPMTDVFAGFPSAMGIVFLFVVLAGLREWAISRITKNDRRKDFRIMMANNITPLVFLFLIAILLTSRVQEDFRMFFAFFMASVSLYVYLTFSLFPAKGDSGFLHWPFLIRLLVAITVSSLIYVVVLGAGGNGFQYFLLNMVSLFIITPLSWILYVQRKDKIVELRGMKTALAKSSADISFLRSQINPHFLFNVLNTLYGTAIKEKSEQTAAGIQKLGDMMRFMLHENQRDYIPMENELNYLVNYIDIQRLRTNDNQMLSIEENLEGCNCQGEIAPMLLIPFVENAFKHGISANDKSWIKINLVCTETLIEFEVQNSVHPVAAGDSEARRSGIGLKNVEERLKLLYPSKHILDIQKTTEEFCIKLTLSRSETKY